MCFIYQILNTPSPTLSANWRRRETSRTSDCSSQCDGILPLKGELEGVCTVAI